MSFSPLLMMVAATAEFDEAYNKEDSFGMSLSESLVQFLGVTEILSYARKHVNNTHQVFLTRAREGRIHLIALHRVNAHEYLLSPSDELFRDNFIANSKPQHLYNKESASSKCSLFKCLEYLVSFVLYGVALAPFVMSSNYAPAGFYFFMCVLFSTIPSFLNTFSTSAAKEYTRASKAFEIQDRTWFREERNLQRSQFPKVDFKKVSKYLVSKVVCTV